MVRVIEMLEKLSNLNFAKLDEEDIDEVLRSVHSLESASLTHDTTMTSPTSPVAFTVLKERHSPQSETPTSALFQATTSTHNQVPSIDRKQFPQLNSEKAGTRNELNSSKTDNSRELNVRSAEAVTVTNSNNDSSNVNMFGGAFEILNQQSSAVSGTGCSTMAGQDQDTDDSLLIYDSLAHEDSTLRF